MLHHTYIEKIETMVSPSEMYQDMFTNKKNLMQTIDNKERDKLNIHTYY